MENGPGAESSSAIALRRLLSAIQAMDGADLDGRSLKVNEARERPQGGGGGRGGKGGYGGGGGRGGDRW